MNQVIDFAGIAGAIGLSIAFGVYLQWLGLRGLMRLMPVKANPARVSRETAENYRLGKKAA